MFAVAYARRKPGSKPELAAVGAWFDDAHLYIDRLGVGQPHLTDEDEKRFAEAAKRERRKEATPEDERFLRRVRSRRVRNRTLIFLVYHDRDTFTKVRVEWGGWPPNTYDEVTLDRI